MDFSTFDSKELRELRRLALAQQQHSLVLAITCEQALRALACASLNPSQRHKPTRHTHQDSPAS